MHDSLGEGGASLAEMVRGCSAREREFIALRIKHGADGSGRGSWACSVCTFENDAPDSSTCAMCETEKQAAAAPRTFNIRSMVGDFDSVAVEGGLDDLLGKLDTHATLSRAGTRARLFVGGSEDALTPDTFRALAPGTDLFLLHSTETELACRRLSPYWGEPDWDY